MNLYLSIPLLFLKFWFIDAPLRLINYYLTLNRAAMEFLSLPLMLRTFFVPLKNEYRKGLVIFSIVMGMIIKTILISLSIFVMLILIAAELGILAFFVAWPFLAFYLLLI